MNFKPTVKNISLRPVTGNDMGLLYEIYCSSRSNEIALMNGCTIIQKETFLKLQFKAQHEYYLHHFEKSCFSIIERNESPIGRLYLDEKYEDSSLRIIDITLLPQWRDKGIGTKILLQLLAYARGKKQRVTLHVEISNKAINLYKRLEFKEHLLNRTHYFMQWDF